MIKFIAPTIFFILFAISIYIMLTNLSSVDEEDYSLKTPEQRLRANITNVKLYSYKDSKITSIVEAKKAFFQQKEVIRLREGVKGTVYRDNNLQKFHAEEADILLDQVTNKTAFSGLRLNKIHANESVKLFVQDNVLKTNKATYNVKENNITSNEVVEIIGQGKKFHGNKGFTLSLADESFVIFGETEGVFDNDSFKK